MMNEKSFFKQIFRNIKQGKHFCFCLFIISKFYFSIDICMDVCRHMYVCMDACMCVYSNCFAVPNCTELSLDIWIHVGM